MGYAMVRLGIATGNYLVAVHKWDKFGAQREAAEEEKWEGEGGRSKTSSHEFPSVWIITEQTSIME